MLPRRLLVAVLIENMQQKEIELIERMIYKSGDDIAVSIARSFERLEERIDASESRIYSRLSDIEDGLGEGLKAVRLIVEGDSEVVIAEK